MAVAEASEGPRSSWGFAPGTLQLRDDDVVELYEDDSDRTLFIADCRGDYLFGGAISSVPREWLDAESIRFYFRLSVEEFLARPQ